MTGAAAALTQPRARGRVALIYPRPALDSVPSLCQAIELLAEHGYGVDVYTWTSPDVPDARFASGAIRVRPIGWSSVGGGARARRSVLWRALMAPLRRVQARRAEHREHATRARAWRGVLRDTQTLDYHCIIGVDPDGLLMARELAAEAGAPLVYYSLELLLTRELRDETSAALKKDERDANRAAALTIVQDEERAGLLVEDNGLDWTRVALVPNAPLGPARRQPSRYWQDRLGLRDDRRIVLHAGSVGAWTGIDRLVDAAATWPEPWMLIVHTRYDAESSAYVDGLRGRAHAGRVRFSVKPVPRQEYETLVDGADAGLAFYVPTNESAYTQENIRSIGLSSGKFASYARAGVPVIANRDSTLGKLVEEAGVGVAVQSAEEVGNALRRIEREQDAMSGRALRFFDQRLDFARAFARVSESLDTLVARSRAASDEVREST